MRRVYRISIEKTGSESSRIAMTNAPLQLETNRFMNRIRIGMVWVFLMTGLITSCKDEIRIPNFEAERWKTDGNGCNGDRQKLLTPLIAGRSALIGRSEMEIKKFLGKPDANDLRPRGQKFFEYGVRGGTLCDPNSTAQPEILRIRFDALDRVTEVSMY